MKPLIVALALAGAVAVASPSVHARGGETAAAVLAGAVIGASAAAIVASAARHEHYRPAPRPVPRRYRPGAFSPHRGIVCHPELRVCVLNNGRVDPRWTRLEYGR